ncbi:carbamoyltransferase HypF [Clostridium manihotivorum]|uniref:carbamoyltransferase HypF n=1 Tax=Clostridium manihotivorum TaxID=2320868 RepID=UPI0013E31CA0|nr:carbamoyltransferase HypF [Clostridium manihotivorum]
MIRKLIVVRGLVQGVGFRPFVYGVAKAKSLRGNVKNTNEGLIIDVEGSKEAINEFIDILSNNGPKNSKINEIIQKDKSICNYEDFKIEASTSQKNGFTYISPDMGTCNACYEELLNKDKRRYNYGFTNCTDCGPRYSVIEDIPYERAVTTMSKFELCSSCASEYKDVKDRRFNAETNCCSECGPQLALINSITGHIYEEEVITNSIKLIKEGNILSVKGIGGFNLVCDGNNEKAILRLRKRKNRRTKPFALMMKDIETIKNYCKVSSEEEEVLKSSVRPIVILDKSHNKLPEVIAPGNNTLGVMLPYTPLHYLLFQEGIETLVMTSGNINGTPIIYSNKEAIEKLSKVADYHLINDREIYNSVDDSVIRFVLGKERVIRRGRGYAPTYFNKSGFKESISLGAYLKNSFCFYKDEHIVFSQYIGDMDNTETFARYESTMKKLTDIYNLVPKLIAYDLHPNTPFYKYLDKLPGKMIGVYHHHAHIASVLFENQVKGKVIGIAFDGSGYGEDGTVWGGEFLISDFKEFKRVGYLNSVAMPGGDRAAKEPIRMAVAYLYKTYKGEAEEQLLSLSEQYITANRKLRIRNYLEMIEKNINCPKTSSMGRLFDAVAYILGFSGEISFEGEAAIFLENLACSFKKAEADVDVEGYAFCIEKQGDAYVVNTDNIIKGIIDDVKRNIRKGVISRKLHNTIAEITEIMCLKLSKDYGIKEVALSGGVFQNKLLLEEVYESLSKDGFKVYMNSQIPCNDGGISVGQIVIANEREME